MKWYNPITWFKRSKPTPTATPEPTLDGKLSIIQAGFEPDGKLKLEVEYDDVFVKALRQRGYVGIDDHQLVMKYVGDVYRTITSNADGANFD